MLKYVLAVFLIAASFNTAAADKVMDRVHDKQELNCGVYELGSIFSHDTAGKPQGFTVDLMSEVSARTGLKIKYSEISSFGTLRQDMEGGKYDMICAPVLLLPATAFKYLPGIRIMTDPVNIYADSSADLTGIKTLKDLNDVRYAFVGMDGELGGIYAPKLFPKAKLNLLSMGSMPSQMFMELHTKKANFIVLTRLAAAAYLKDHPGKIKQVTTESILNSSVHQFFPNDAYGLKANIDAIIEDMQQDGTMDRLLTKNGIAFN